MKPPVAKRIPTDVSVHDDRRVDEYAWLRDRENPEVIAYLNEENAYAEAMLEPTREFQEQLYREMVARINETDSSVPVTRDDFHYYTRTEKGRQYEVFCRRRGALDGPEQVLLDENRLAEGHAYHAIGSREVSLDHRLLAYTVDMSGGERYQLVVVDLDAGRVVDGPIDGVAADIEWDNDSRSIFYLVLDDAMRPYAVRRHVVGEPVARDVELHRETDVAFYMGIEVTRSRDYLFVTMESHTTSEVHALRLSDGRDAALRIVQPRKAEVEYHVAHSGDWFFIMINEEALNFRVFEAPAKNPRRERWREIIPHRPAVKIDGLEAFEKHLVVIERENGLKRIRIIDLVTRASSYVAFDEPVYTVWLERNPEFHERVLRFNYSSLTTPRTVFDYDMEKGTRVLRKRYEVLGGFDPSRYVGERVFAVATDGTRVPISLVYRRDTPRDGTAPLILYGYGAYGVCVEPHFVSNRLGLLDRGMVFAIAHIRGGGALGRMWYEKGKRLYKRNTFTDFIACAEHLIEKGYTSSGKLVCYGGSAGGMLVGAVLNMRPDLWRAAMAVVPFVDVLNTMLDPTLPLTVIEYDEWGNPEDRKYYEYIRSYSPYDDVRRHDYPAMLVLSGFNDPRVQYWEPAKWVARLRARKTDSNPVLLRTRMGEGHKGASGRYDYLRDVALEYAFIFQQFGIGT